jgi:GNAT superfamily N-acetyltransferase/RimJ/RimL family protein N-acetyltransferase
MMRIAFVDPRDEPAFRAWFEAFDAGLRAGRVDPPVKTYPELLAHHQNPPKSSLLRVFAAYDEHGSVLGAGTVELPQRDNRSLAMLELAVPPQWRGRGVGQALLAYATEQARTAGRSRLLAEVFVPCDVDPAGWPGARFAERHGFTNRNTEILRVMRLPIPPARMAALEAEVAERTAGYTFVSWSGACPAEYAEQYATLKGLLMAEAPTGDLDYEPEDWDVDRLRDEERRAVMQGRTVYTTVAIAPDGSLAGHTQLAVSVHDPRRAYQWDTLVVAAHRGHRLGLAVKLANLQAMTAAEPQVERVTTWNAQQNGPMIAVNEAMGFAVAEILQERQKDL